MPRQTFTITRAPEEPPLTGDELSAMLYFARTSSEWEARECTALDDALALLEKLRTFGYANPGRGYTCAKMTEDLLDAHGNGEGARKQYRDIHHMLDDMMGPAACRHPGCRSHISHPCESCGQQWNADGTLFRNASLHTAQDGEDAGRKK